MISEAGLSWALVRGLPTSTRRHLTQPVHNVAEEMRGGGNVQTIVSIASQPYREARGRERGKLEAKEYKGPSCPPVCGGQKSNEHWQLGDHQQLPQVRASGLIGLRCDAGDDVSDDEHECCRGKEQRQSERCAVYACLGHERGPDDSFQQFARSMISQNR